MFPDYRYVDLGMRITDRLIRIQEVLKPDAPETDPVEHGRPAEAVKASRDLLELEARSAAASSPRAAAGRGLLVAGVR